MGINLLFSYLKNITLVCQTLIQNWDDNFGRAISRKQALDFTSQTKKNVNNCTILRL